MLYVKSEYFMNQYDRQCAYSVRMRCVVQQRLQWKSNRYYIFWVRVCGLRYPAWNAHAPYRHLWPVRFYYIFPTLSHKRHDFWKIITEHKMCFDFLYNFCLKHFSLLEEFSDKWSKMYVGLHVKYPIFLSDSNGNWIFSTCLRKKMQILNLIKIRPL